VNIGTVFTFNLVIGRVVRVMMEAAISSVNADPRILNGTKLKIKLYILNKIGYRLTGY
jgi:ionotropic glutamate receptor